MSLESHSINGREFIRIETEDLLILDLGFQMQHYPVSTSPSHWPISTYVSPVAGDMFWEVCYRVILPLYEHCGVLTWTNMTVMSLDRLISWDHAIHASCHRPKLQCGVREPTPVYNNLCHHSPPAGPTSGIHKHFPSISLCSVFWDVQASCEFNTPDASCAFFLSMPVM